MARKRGAAKAASNSLFVWIPVGQRRRLVSRRRAKALGINVEAPKAAAATVPAAPTKKQLLARAEELGIGDQVKKSMKNDDIAAAIGKAEAAKAEAKASGADEGGDGGGDGA